MKNHICKDCGEELSHIDNINDKGLPVVLMSNIHKYIIACDNCGDEIGPSDLPCCKKQKHIIFMVDKDGITYRDNEVEIIPDMCECYKERMNRDNYSY